MPEEPAEVWAPLQHILVLGLRRVGTPLAHRTAVDIADRFTNAVAEEWQTIASLFLFRPEGVGSGRRYVGDSPNFRRPFLGFSEFDDQKI